MSWPLALWPVTTCCQRLAPTSSGGSPPYLGRDGVPEALGLATTDAERRYLEKRLHEVSV